MNPAFSGYLVRPAHSVILMALCLIACGGGGGGSSNGGGGTPPPVPAPTVSLVSNGTAVQPGGSVVLTWSSTNAQSCAASGGWSGSKAISGSELVFVGTTAADFGLTCQGAGGSSSQNVPIGILPPAPVVALTANAATIAIGTTTTLNWNVTGATTCTASGGWNGSRATTGSEATASLAADTSFTLSCVGDGGSGTASLTVNARPLPTVALWFEPEKIEAGGLTRAHWVARNTTQCTASGAWSGSRAANDNVVVGPLAAGESVFTLTCGSALGDATASTTITAQTPVKFFSFDFVALTEAHSSMPLYPVSGEPVVGEGTAIAVLSGPVANASFRFVDLEGNELLGPLFSRGASESPGLVPFKGSMTLPTDPFSVVATGVRADGVAFSVRHERVFRPQSIGIELGGTPLTTEVAAPLRVKVRIVGEGAEVMVRCTGERPLQISPTAARIQVAADSEATASFDVLAAGPVSLEDGFPKASCFAVALGGASSGHSNSSSITLPVEDVLTADLVE